MSRIQIYCCLVVWLLINISVSVAFVKRLYSKKFHPSIHSKPQILNHFNRKQLDTRWKSRHRTVINTINEIENEDEDIRRHIDNNFLHVSVPAFFSLAAEPLVSLVDAMFVGKLGPIQQAGVGIASSAQFSVSKLYNDPLLKTATSLVAGKTGDELTAAVATAITSASLIGGIQALVFLLFSSEILQLMGVSMTSTMRQPALSYLRWRALGVPASTLLLVTNGIFRGRGDTKTPFYCTVAGNMINMVLDPVLIFGLNMGCAGAGAALALSQWVAAIPLLWLLHNSIPFNILKQNPRRLAEAFEKYYKAGALIFIRTVTKISAYTVTASSTAKLGAIPMAAYSLTFNLGFTAAQLCESVAIAAQAFLARDMPFQSKKQQTAAKHTISRSLEMGLFISLGLTVSTMLNINRLLNSMTTSPDVRKLAASVMPIVLFAQVMKGISSSTGSILLGGCDWLWSTLSMNVAATVCISLIVILPKSLTSIWIALAAFMTTQVLVALLRIGSGTGPWKPLFGHRPIRFPWQSTISQSVPSTYNSIVNIKNLQNNQNITEFYDESDLYSANA